jgi:integrase
MGKKNKRVKKRGGLSPDQYLTRQQALQLIEYNEKRKASNNKQVKTRAFVNSILLRVMFNSGLRASEVCGLQMRDLPVYHGKPVIDVRRGKGCVRRSIEINSNLVEQIKKYAQKYHRSYKPRHYFFINERGGPLSYGSMYSKIKILGKGAGIDYIHPHALRHSYGYMFYNNQPDLLMLQDQLGHADPRTTAIYAKTANEGRRKIAESFYI